MDTLSGVTSDVRVEGVVENVLTLTGVRREAGTEEKGSLRSEDQPLWCFGTPSGSRDLATPGLRIPVYTPVYGGPETTRDLCRFGIRDR